VARDIAVVIGAKDRASPVIGRVSKSFGGLGKIATTAVGFAVGTLAVKGVGALVGKMKGAIDVAADFESQINILGIAARSSGTSMDVLRKASIKVGGDTELVGINASQAADAITSMYKAGLDTTAIFGDLDAYMKGTAGLTGVLRAAVDLQAASELDLAAATDVVSVAMATFGMSEKEAIAIADSFVRTADASVAEVYDLTEAMRNVGPVAAQFGWSLQDVNTALAILSTRGIKGSEAGTALRSMMTNLMRPTDKTTDVLDELGVELYDAEGRMRTLPAIIKSLSAAFTGQMTVTKQVGGATKEQTKLLKEYDRKIRSAQTSLEEYRVGAKGASLTDKTRAKKMAELTKKVALYQKKKSQLNITEAKLVKTTKKLTEEQKNQYIQILAGTYGMKAMNTLLAEGVEGWEDMAGAINKAATAQEVAEARTRGFRASMEQLHGVLESLWIRVGTPLITNFLTPAAKGLAQLLERAMEAGGGIKGFAGVIRTELAGLGKKAADWMVPNISETIERFESWVSGIVDWLVSGGAEDRIAEAISGWGPRITEWLDVHAPGGPELTAEQMGFLTPAAEDVEREMRPWWRSIADTIIIGWEGVVTTVEAKAREYRERFSAALFGWLQVEERWEEASAWGPTYESPIMLRFAEWLAILTGWVGEVGIPSLVRILIAFLGGGAEETADTMEREGTLTPLQTAIVDGFREIGTRAANAFWEGLRKGFAEPWQGFVKDLREGKFFEAPEIEAPQTREQEQRIGQWLDIATSMGQLERAPWQEFGPLFRDVISSLRTGIQEASEWPDVVSTETILPEETTAPILKEAETFGTEIGERLIIGTERELGIRSASKVYKRIGEDMAEGMAEGLKSATSVWQVTDAIIRLVGESRFGALPMIQHLAQQTGRSFALHMARGVLDGTAVANLANSILTLWQRAAAIAAQSYRAYLVPPTPTTPTGPYGALGPTFPGYEFGGIVPGPIGKPRMVMAHGGEEFLGVGARRRAGVVFDFRGARFYGVSQEFVEDLFEQHDITQRLQGMRD